MSNSIECPTCGTHRLKPFKTTSTARWGDCVCSEVVTCVYHQLHPEDSPWAPAEAVLEARAEADYQRQLQEWEALRDRFALVKP